jgi:hypothetical protein
MPHTKNFSASCQVLPGVFDSEFYVILGASSAYVSRSCVQVEDLPSSEAVHGRVSVTLVSYSENQQNALVQMPGEVVIGSPRSWIATNSLKAVD